MSLTQSLSPARPAPVTALCLGLGAFVAAAVGLILLWDPLILSPAPGLSEAARVDHANEARSPAGVLLMASGLMAVAIWQRSLRSTALWGMSALYLGYGASRGVAILIDGWPSAALMSAMWIELGLGGFALLCALSNRRQFPDGQ